jgi:phenylalanine ammonia-lyase
LAYYIYHPTRWELIEKINEVLSADITPVVPLRGSISASGGKFDPIRVSHNLLNLYLSDLSPLSYIAGTLGKRVVFTF